jgi:hypothetical protein
MSGPDLMCSSDFLIPGRRRSSSLTRTVRGSMVLVSMLLAGCLGVSHEGFGVEVRNVCGVEIEFFVDSGRSPAKPRSRVIRLGAGETKVYSLIAGPTDGKSGGYIWITSPEQPSPVRFEEPLADQNVVIEVSGSSCEAVEIDRP